MPFETPSSAGIDECSISKLLKPLLVWYQVEEIVFGAGLTLRLLVRGSLRLEGAAGSAEEDGEVAVMF
jgi:hypothetical protein